MTKSPNLLKRLCLLTFGLSSLLLVSVFLGLSTGSSGFQPMQLIGQWFGEGPSDPLITAIIWKIRLPRVILAIQVGAVLSLGGVVFQALLRNPLAEPYILGVSGGAAVGAIIGIVIGLAHFPGVSMAAFAGSGLTLLIILLISSKQPWGKSNSLLLSGVMVNAFCSSIITFFISMIHDNRLHSILFWLMGDLSQAEMTQVNVLFCILIPCILIIFKYLHPMNLLQLGEELAQSMGVNIKATILTLLVTTTLMVSVTISYSGLLGFVGLIVPHFLRLVVGADHRLLAPAAILTGGSYMVFCDILARWLPDQGEIPVGVITAMIGAPLFIILLKRTRT